MKEPNSEETSTPNSGHPYQEPQGDLQGNKLQGQQLPAEGTSVNISDTTAPEANITSPSTADPDAADVEAAMAGSSEHFEKLVLRHQDRIYTHLYFMVHHRETAKDLTQETFMRAYRGLASFRAEARFSSWLKRIAVNTCLHHLDKAKAKKRAQKTVSLSSAQFSAADDNEGSEIQIEDSSENPVQRAIENEQRNAILQAVAKLPSEYRICLSLRELEGYSYQEISDQLGTPIGSVKSKIFRARQLLQESLKEQME